MPPHIKFPKMKEIFEMLTFREYFTSKILRSYVSELLKQGSQLRSLENQLSAMTRARGEQTASFVLSAKTVRDSSLDMNALLQKPCFAHTTRALKCRMIHTVDDQFEFAKKLVEKNALFHEQLLQDSLAMKTTCDEVLQKAQRFSLSVNRSELSSSMMQYVRDARKYVVTALPFGDANHVSQVELRAWYHSHGSSSGAAAEASPSIDTSNPGTMYPELFACSSDDVNVGNGGGLAVAVDGYCFWMGETRCFYGQTWEMMQEFQGHDFGAKIRIIGRGFGL